MRSGRRVSSISHLVIVLALLLFMLSAVTYYEGYLVGMGYTVELRYFISERPLKLAISNFSNVNTHPVMVVSGHAYELKYLNTSKDSPLTFKKPPHTMGNITCELIAGKGIYECYGTGYYFSYLGRRLEIVCEFNVTRHYYGGPALGQGETYVILYGYTFALVLSYVLMPATILIASYVLYRMFKSILKREGKKILYITMLMLVLLLFIIMGYIGFDEGVKLVPKEISCIVKYLGHTLRLGLTLSTVLYLILNVVLLLRLMKRV
ncbi:MAG TPA: hypothetical protein ENG05_00535 [Acidilobales archaeon]|nr:hypothetical protein [Acidilobales archaeon]